jgi:hypothetical protein
MTHRPYLAAPKISTKNIRVASTMAAGATYQGLEEDVHEYSSIGISIHSTNTSDGVLTIQVSHDKINWSEVPRTISNANTAHPHMWLIVERHFKIKYVNGTTEAENLSIQVNLSNNGEILLAHQLDETLLDETEAIIVRSVSVGQNPNDIYTNEKISGVDDGNSSTTNLTSLTSLSFTGEWINISSYASISVIIDGTASGIIGGTLQLQFSHDGITVHRDIVIVNEDITNVPPRTLGVVAQYFRVIFIADSDLTSFIIETMLHIQPIALVSRLDQTLQGIEDVTNVRAVLVGEDHNGIYQNARVSSLGDLQVETDEFAHLLGDILNVLIKMDRRLHVISGYEMIDIEIEN